VPDPRDELLDPAFLRQLERLDVLSRKILSGKMAGARTARRSALAAALLPVDYRNYAPGDDDRFIDWNVYARLDRLVVKLFAQEEDFFLHLLVDVSASVRYGTPEKGLYLRRAAAALGYVGLANSLHVTISAFADSLVAAGSVLRGRRRVAEMIRFLTDLPVGGPSRFAAACRRFAAGRRHRGLCVVLSDFLFRDESDGGWEDGLDCLAAGGHELFCIQALSPRELAPFAGAEGEEVELVDAEGGGERAVRADGRLLSGYLSNLDALRRRLRQAVERRGGGFISVATDLPVDRLVLDYLKENGVLG
jgi:uncharacterized protein (DUF58 family)